MQFEWDEVKNFENIRKHQINFVDVSAMFTEDMLIELNDRLDYSENRRMGIGFLLDVRQTETPHFHSLECLILLV